MQVINCGDSGQSLDEAGYRAYEIPELKVLQEKEQEVQAFIQAFLSVR